MLPLTIIIVALLWANIVRSIKFAFHKHTYARVQQEKFTITKYTLKGEKDIGELTLNYYKCIKCGHLTSFEIERIYY